MLVDGLGNVLGLWVITNIQEKQTFFTSLGLPRKTLFFLSLKKYESRRGNLIWRAINDHLSH